MAKAADKSTDLVATEEVQYSPAVQAMIDSQEADVAAGGTLQVPIIKVTQSTTKEVKGGEAEAGEFFNSLTSESYGDRIEFIVAHYAPGRAYSDKESGDYRNAIGVDEIPESWSKFLGEENVGTRFDEHPDAYEQYSARERRGEIKWGSGPPIATTYNYTGLIVITDEETGEQELMPGRLSFQRSTKDAHKKLSTIKQSLLRGKAFWEVTFVIETSAEKKGNNDFFVVKVKKGRNTTSDEKLRAVELLEGAIRGDVSDNSDAAGSESGAAAPAATGGMDV